MNPKGDGSLKNLLILVSRLRAECGGVFLFKVKASVYSLQDNKQAVFRYNMEWLLGFDLRNVF